MTIRFKLTMASLAVIVVANSLLSWVVVGYLGHVWLEEVQTRVRLDLNSARAAYQSHLQQIVRFLQALSVSRAISAGLETGNQGELGTRLREAYQVGGMDFLCVLDAHGRVVYRARNPGRRGDDLTGNPLIASVLRTRSAASGTIIMSREALAAEAEDLAVRARFDLLPTLAARPTEEQVRTDGMVAAAAVPVCDRQGALLGILFAGDLLSRRDSLVDSIRDEVFPQQLYNDRPIGTVTIFQGDLRIATNVIGKDGSRAVGTRLSAAVCEEVLERGNTWAAPALVVDQWYITAYEPIRDPQGNIIGALYVGLLREPFLRAQNTIYGVFLAMVGGTTLVSLLLLFFVTKLVLRPIGRIVAMSQRVIGGDMSARVGLKLPGEMGLLCQAIDAMADAISQREARLQQAAREQIGRSEKLAALGRLAAGVAHEINNPLTGVLTFAHLLRDKKNADPQDRQDLEVIIRETQRAAGIVRGLLDLAREKPPVKQRLDINEVIRRTLRLLGNQEVSRGIYIVEDLAEGLPPVYGDPNQLQQVVLNLSLNACEAMPEGGTLMLTTSAKAGRVIVKVVDTGCGIKREDLERIFEPFFSTKPIGKGTGLGLSVSYGIVEQHGGTLEVESQEGRGSTFTITLPAAQENNPSPKSEGL
mgnify:CR=1 FL=1